MARVTYLILITNPDRDRLLRLLSLDNPDNTSTSATADPPDALYTQIKDATPSSNSAGDY